MDYPLISCVCPTFGKVKHLEEAVYSFHQQTYPNKELIIFNNYDKVDILYEHPDVTVINYKGEITGGTAECRNLGNQFARGKYIATWDDDDISLEDRLMIMYSRLQDGRQQKRAFRGYTGGALYSEANTIIKYVDKFLSNSLIEREYLLDNLYQNGDGDDQYMYNKMSDEGVGCYDLKRFFYYIYRWDTGTYHVSGKANMTTEQVRDEMTIYVNSLNLPSTLLLHPYWERDYQLDVDNFNNLNK